MSDVQSMAPGLSHVVFLERAAREHDSAQSRFGQAAFLVLRLVDQLGVRQTAPNGGDLFGYQAAATGRYCEENLEPGAQAEQLLEVVRAASYAHRRHQPGHIATSLLALARSLQDAARPAEAGDVLETLERVTGAGLDAAAAITAAFLRARLERESNRFDAADAAYERAGTLARAAGDGAAILFSRIGRANVMWGRGNLAEAERRYRQVLAEATATGLRQPEAHAEHGLGVVLGTRGQVPDALPHLWRAFDLYNEEHARLRALHDLGFSLTRLGAIDSAERAFLVVIGRDPEGHEALDARVELMHCASFRRDRLAFERWRAESVQYVARMAPNQLADYHLKLGIGLARFGRFDRAAVELNQALLIARGHGLHEFEFRIERIVAGLEGCVLAECEREGTAEPPAWAATLVQMSRALAGLAPNP
jgi:tetratricopeptide (TPR) repeat protein